MRKLIAAIVIVLMCGGCTAMQKGAALGAALGGGVGGATGGSPGMAIGAISGAVIGGTVGLVVGTLTEQKEAQAEMNKRIADQRQSLEDTRQQVGQLREDLKRRQMEEHPASAHPAGFQSETMDDDDDGTY